MLCGIGVVFNFFDEGLGLRAASAALRTGKAGSLLRQTIIEVLVEIRLVAELAMLTSLRKPSSTPETLSYSSPERTVRDIR